MGSGIHGTAYSTYVRPSEVSSLEVATARLQNRRKGSVCLQLFKVTITTPQAPELVALTANGAGE